MKKISILMLTIDRFETTVNTFNQNLSRMGLTFGAHVEILVCDNGSSDKKIVEYFQKSGITYHRVNSKNEGVAHAFNQLYLRSSGEYIVLLGNDLLLPERWADEAIKYLDAVPNSGIAGFDWGHGSVPPVSKKFGYFAHWLTPTLNRVFGVWVLKRRVIEEVGLFDEEFTGYGLEDSDMNERVNRAGFNSFYIPNMKSEHLCHDVGEKSNYRRMKDSSMLANAFVFARKVEFYDSGEKIKAELPAMKEPI